METEHFIKLAAATGLNVPIKSVVRWELRPNSDPIRPVLRLVAKMGSHRPIRIHLNE